MEINVFARQDISRSMDTAELAILIQLTMVKIASVIWVTMETEINVKHAISLAENAVVLVQTNA